MSDMELTNLERGRRTRPWQPAALGSVLLVAACGSGDLAEAGGRSLSVDDAATFLEEHAVRVDSQAVRVMAELWVDYTLLATYLAEDTALSTLDVSRITGQAIEQRMLDELQAQVIEIDTVVDMEELRERFAAELPGARVTASHIMLGLLPDAPQERRDSLSALADQILAELNAGADFGTLARRYSGDPGSAPAGGSLGTFRRGEMIPELEQALFTMRPGDVAGPIETHLGLHIVRVDGLDIPAFEEGQYEFRSQVLLERLAEAEANYILDLEEQAGLELADGAVDIARSLGEDPLATLGAGAQDRALLTYDGGAYTVAEFRDLVQGSSAPFLEQLNQSNEEELDQLLRRLGRQEILVEEARSQGFEPAAAAVDSVNSDARRAIAERARALGMSLVLLAGAGDEPGRVAVQVDSALIRVVSGEQEIVPLGGLTYLLRDAGSWRIVDSAVRATADRVQELRDEGR